MENKKVFRSPINNNYLLRGLFFEMQGLDKGSVIYTLKDHDHEGCLSFYRLYMEIDDPTEWEVSQKLVDGWEHWEMLSNCTWFKPYIERWRKELELRFKSKALQKIRTEAKTGSKDSLAANKYLLEKGWEAKERQGRGRPSKDEIKRAADDMARVNVQVSKDYQRLGLLN